MTRYIPGYGEPLVTREWYDKTFGPFSDEGAVVDAKGRMGGLLTGGGTTDSTDMSYATPLEFLLTNMEEAGFRKPRRCH